MAYTPGQLQKTKTSSGGYVPGSLSKKKTGSSSSVDFNDIEQLKAFAESKGLKVKEKKPSLFRRAMDFISRPLYASAGAAKAIVKGGENPLLEAWKGLSGQEKETYSDVLEEAGVTNKWIKGGVGFALDIALDPTTYFGGAILKGAGKVTKLAGKGAMRGIKAVNPDLARGLEITGVSLKDALGKAFVYGYGTTKGLSDDVSRTINKLGMAKESVIEENIKRFGKYSADELDEAGNLMIKNRKLELQARQIKATPQYLKSENARVNELVDVMKNKAKEMAKQAGLDPEKAYENYIPFLRTDKLAKGVEQSTSALQVGKQGYKKEFRDLIPDDKLLKKPIEAYTRREFEIVRDSITKNSLNDFVEVYGKKLDDFKSADEALEQGYRIIKDKKFGKALGYLKENDFNFINNYLFPEFKTIDNLAKATGFDMFTRWFKTAVTSWFPAFHIRNYISGNIQNYEVLGREVFNPKNHNIALKILKGLDEDIVLGGNKYNLKQLKTALDENFQGASRYISDIGNYIEEMAANNFRIRKMTDPGRKVGNFIEMNQKAVAVATALDRGDDLKTALKMAEQAGFDYSKITKFESKVLRRLIPFYSFARKNAELQLRTLATKPARILNQTKFANAMSNVFGGKTTEEDIKGLPEWALSGLGFKVSGNRYLTKFGLPIEEFIERLNRPVFGQLSSLNPIVKYPLESKLGFDFFREEKISDIRKISPELVKILPQPLKEKLNVQERSFEGKKYYYADPRYLHILRNLPTARLESTLEKLADKDMAKVDKLLAFFTGARIYDIDIELQKYFEERDLKRQVEDELIMRGDVKKFERLYIPKN